uniref:NADH-ubiquinone oxidoreductase chain 4L n=1 Tax=Xenoturbella bocki TaxID=242395 RepID=A0EYM9_XENBC|nr:NADH dehydrogenase subunit 4L [Xenoturbella bocki]ABG54252.1 NADH dehydrogenase subunit 4L [Xenoturbella bocki]CAL30096.1 NADH dehydrogenase subunit 4L [Xenoturbella bocki]
MPFMNLVLMMMFMCSVTGLMMNRPHFLTMLLCLEAAMVSTLMIMMIKSHMNPSNTMMLTLTMITMAVCEASVGLSLLASITRTHASDMVTNLNMLKC